MNSICRIQSDILQLILSGEPLTVVVGKITAWLESELTGSCKAVIYLTNQKTNHLVPIPSNSLSEEISAAFTNNAFTKLLTSTNNSDINNQPVIVENGEDAIEENFKHFLLNNNIRSYCIIPLVNSNHEQRGTLLLLFNQPPGTLSQTNTEVIQLAAQTSLLAIEINLTEKISSPASHTKSQLLEQSEERLIMAIESAKMGTWNIDPFTKKLTLSDREKELHGFSLEEAVTLNRGIDLVPEFYREKLTAAIEETLQTGLPFELEYPVEDFTTRQIRWLKSTGKLFYNREGIPITLSGTSIDITERKTDEMRRNDFMAVASHELKTPLTSISAYMQVLEVKAQMIADVTLNDIVEKCNKQVNKMMGMVQEFLDVSRIDAGKTSLQLEAFDLGAVIKEEVTEIRLTVHTHTILLDNPEVIKVIADREKIARVINNILRNAVKYSPQGSTIAVDVKKNRNTVMVKVTDEGMGINATDQSKIFDRYYRVDNNDMPIKSGFGIGLYLSKQIIELHKGKIGVKSKQNKGSTFYFALLAES